MTEPQFTADIRKALDSYAVPHVPAGFTDRLMTRIASGDVGSIAGAPPAVSKRARRTSPWRRTSRIAGSLAAFSLATVTAAAAGFFGEPIYMPGISEALDKANIVAAAKPEPAPVRHLPVIAAPKTESVPPAEVAAAEDAAPSGRAAIVERVNELRQDPEFARLTPRQKRMVAGQEIRQIVRSGEASRDDIRPALREIARDTLAERAARRQAMAERRQAFAERQEPIALVGDPLPQGAPPAAELSQMPAAAEIALPKPGDSQSPVAAATLPTTKAQALREYYRSASPEQRAAIRRALRERREMRRQRLAQ